MGWRWSEGDAPVARVARGVQGVRVVDGGLVGHHRGDRGGRHADEDWQKDNGLKTEEGMFYRSTRLLDSDDHT